jgi:hypothetical protein
MGRVVVQVGFSRRKIRIQKQAKYEIYGAHGVTGQVSVRVTLCPSVSILASVPFPIRISVIYRPRYVISGTHSHTSLHFFSI